MKLKDRHLLLLKPPGGACWSVVYRCVNKNRRERVLFSSWALRSAVIIQGKKNAIFVGKGHVFFTKYTKGCRSKRVGVLIYYTRMGYFLTGHSEKGLSIS